MRAIYTADLHLTDRAEDEYRFGIFPFLRTQAKNRKLDLIVIVGDLTDKKDEHSSVLVNQIFDNLSTLADLCPVHILKGNHDYVDAAHPFFRFLGRPLQAPTRIVFHADPAEIAVRGQRLLFLPHSRTFRRMVNDFQLEKYDTVFIHQPVQGAEAENGDSVAGIHPNSVKRAKRVIAGDLHVPQTIKNITYCGAPHPIRFGDSFKPRVLYQEGESVRSIPRTTISKAIVNISTPEEIADAGLTAGDQCKVNVHLRRRDLGDWDKISRRITDLLDEAGIRLVSLKLVEKEVRRRRADKVESVSTNPLKLWKEYGRKHKIDDEVLKAGILLLQEN